MANKALALLAILAGDEDGVDGGATRWIAFRSCFG
jgi:hypothetical protein